MELSFLILKQIVSMFLMIVVGYVLVRSKAVEKNLGTFLAKVVMYVVLPCTIVDAFQIDNDPKTFSNLLFAFVVALVFNILLIILSYAFKSIFKMNEIEQASVAYPNSGDILIPLVTSVLSPTMTVYCCAFMVVQLLFMFTHGVNLLANDSEKNLSNILKNPNVIAIVIGILLLAMNITISEIVGNVIDSFASMVAPLSMLVIGCSIANCDLKRGLAKKRTYLIVLIRQVIFPLIFLGIIKITSLDTFIQDGASILLILYMAVASSPAATIVNIVQSHDMDSSYASIINVVGVICLIFTMPIMVFIFQVFI